MKSELDLFAMPYTQSSIETSIYVEVPPLSAISDTSPLQLFIAGNGEDYIDLSDTLLQLQCRMTWADGSNQAQADQVQVINYPLVTMFSRVDVSWETSWWARLAVHPPTGRLWNASWIMVRKTWLISSQMDTLKKKNPLRLWTKLIHPNPLTFPKPSRRIHSYVRGWTAVPHSTGPIKFH